VVARVGATDITIARLGDELLRREGSDAVLDWMQSRLERLDWSALPDDAVVLAVGGHELRKRDLVAAMVRSNGAKVREQLIDIAIVEQAVAKAGIVIDDAAMAAEFRLMERDFLRKLKAQGQGHIDFASYLRVKEKMTVEQFLAQPAIRMLAGLHQLVRREVAGALDDGKLQAKLDAERARWDQRPAVDLSVIHIPWRKDPDGRVTQEEQVRLQGVANLIHRQLVRKEVTFAKAWEAFGKAWDTSGPEGRVGWVDPDGRREDETQRQIARGAVERAFASEGPFPVLLPPHTHEGGVELVLVHGKRPARRVELAEVRERLIQDVFEQGLEARTAELVKRLRAEAAVAYGSLPEAQR
jgi:hypothetical protein